MNGIARLQARLPMVCILAVLVVLPLRQVSAAERPADVFAPSALTLLPREGWLTNGGNFSNQRYSPLTAIDRQNVAQLKGVWRTHLNGSGVGPQYSGAAQPIVHDGRVYIITGANDVFALDVETGAILWQYAARLDPAISTVCCGWTNRGVGLGRGQAVLRRARWPARRARPAHRQGALVGAGRTLAGRLLHHQRAALLRRHGDHRLRGRGVSACAAA